MKQAIAYITSLILLNGCNSLTAVKTENIPASKPVSTLEDKANKKIRVEIFFDPSCSHCHEYFDWIESSGLSEKYAQDVEFKKVCVEFVGLGKEGRCREQYGQDGEGNFLVLFSRCTASGDEYHCGVPRVFLNGKYIPDRGNLEKHITAEQILPGN